MIARLKSWVRPPCAAVGCERGRVHWSDFCKAHLTERIRNASRARAQAEFERDVAVQVEALRRFHESTQTQAKETPNE